jgi:hypothetical protein
MVDDADAADDEVPGMANASALEMARAAETIEMVVESFIFITQMNFSD